MAALNPGCANWLRYGIQPEDCGPGLEHGRCGGRRVLVSREWSGKTLGQH